MALYHKWDVKNDFAYVLQFFSLISGGLGGVYLLKGIRVIVRAKDWPVKKITKANVITITVLTYFRELKLHCSKIKFAVHVLTKIFHCQKLTKIVREKKS